MTLPPPTPSASLQILKTVLYILSGLVLVVGLIVGISLMSSASNAVANIIMPFQLLGNQAVSNLIAPMISGFLINLGIITLILSVILSALLYSVGRLIGHIALLEARLARLEARP